MKHHPTPVLNGEVPQAVLRQRERLGISQRQLAGAAGMSRTTLAKIESGTRVSDASTLRVGETLAALEVLRDGPALAEIDDRLETVEVKLAEIEFKLAWLVAAIGEFAITASAVADAGAVVTTDIARRDGVYPQP